MSERIYARDAGGKLAAREGGRTPGKVYSDIGRDADGAVRLREWSDAEVAKAAAEAEAHAAAMEAQRRVAKLKIVERLKAAGLLVAANAALNNAETPDNIELAERWYRSPDDVAANDPRVLDFLAAIGANAEEILAP